MPMSHQHHVEFSKTYILFKNILFMGGKTKILASWNMSHYLIGYRFHSVHNTDSHKLSHPSILSICRRSSLTHQPKFLMDYLWIIMEFFKIFTNICLRLLLHFSIIILSYFKALKFMWDFSALNPSFFKVPFLVCLSLSLLDETSSWMSHF